MTQTQAYQAAGFSSTGKGVENNASRLVKKDRVASRLAWLQAKIAKSTIMTKQECAEMLTRICKTKHSDFLTMSADGVWFHDIGPETLNQEALKKVKTRIQTEKNGGGDSEVIVEKQFDEIELESKVTAVQALSKLMGYDAPQKVDVTTDTLKAVLDEINNGAGEWYGPSRKGKKRR
jgi:hypothetical protein